MFQMVKKVEAEKEKTEGKEESKLYVRTWKLVPVEDWRPATREEEEQFFKEFKETFSRFRDFRVKVEKSFEKMLRFWRKMEEALEELWED